MEPIRAEVSMKMGKKLSLKAFYVLNQKNIAELKDQAILTGIVTGVCGICLCPIVFMKDFECLITPGWGQSCLM